MDVGFETVGNATLICHDRGPVLVTDPWLSGHAVLAAGGIENARLLLLSDAARPAGLGNQHDLVGRFFMEHPHLPSGVLTLADPPPSTMLYETHRVRGTVIRGGLALSPEVIRREGLLNYSVLLKPRVLPVLAALRQMRGSLRRRVLSDHVWVVRILYEAVGLDRGPAPL